MSADQKDRFIEYLVEKVNALDLDKRAMELAVDEFQGIHNNVLEQLTELQQSMVRAGRRMQQVQKSRGKSREARPTVEVCPEEQVR